jgi:hypothetical protein
MGEAVYAIDAFPDDDFHWRIEWIGGLGCNTSAPSDPDDCVHAIAVDDNEAPFAPSNYGSWNEANRGDRRDFPGRV